MIDILANQQLDYTKANSQNIIPVATFAHSKVNRSSLPDLQIASPLENKQVTIGIGEKRLEEFNCRLSQDKQTLNELIEIDLAEDSHAELIFHYQDDGRTSYQRASEFQVKTKPGAHLTIYLIQRLSQQSDSRCVVRVACGADSQVRLVNVDAGGASHGLDLRVDLEARADFDCQSIYFGQDQERYDYNYNLVHHGPLSRSNLLVNGALKDEAKKVFRGTIDFRTGSTGSVGNESEYVTMLDDSVTNIAIPLLLCTEDNVEGNHAASSGRLDPDMVYYVMSRGFSRKEAEKMIIISRFSHVLDLLPQSGLRDSVLHDIVSKLD